MTPPLREETGMSAVEPLDALARQRLAELSREHRDFLRGLAHKLCRANFDPEDLVQDVLLKTAAHFDRLPADVNHAAWMARVMRNLFIDRVRARASAGAVVELDDVSIAAPPPEARAWWESLSRDELRAAAAQLPDELRAAFERFGFEGKSYKEISVELGVPVATVGTRVLRARRRLRAMLGGGDDA